MSMECTEFAELCISPNALNVLSADEQRLILFSMVLKDHNYMPEDFNRSNLTRLMSQSAVICSTNYSYHPSYSGSNENLQFSVNQSVNLLGFAIDLNFESTVSQHRRGFATLKQLPSALKNLLKEMKLTVSDANGTIMSEGKVSHVRNVNGKDIIFVSPPKKLQPGETFYIKCCTPPNTPNYGEVYHICNSHQSDLLHNSASNSQLGTNKNPHMVQGFSSGSDLATSQSLFGTAAYQESIQFSLHGSYSLAPITGIIFDPQIFK
jgi:hypothetical protein